MGKTVLMNFRLDEELRRKYHIWCLENGYSIAERLRNHIQTDISGKTLVKPSAKKTEDWRDQLT